VIVLVYAGAALLALWLVARQQIDRKQPA